MRNKGTLTNIDNSDLTNYPNGRIKNNDGSGNGTPVNEAVKGDIHEFFDKAMRLYGITHNGLPDNETNGYQSLQAIIALASKNDFVLDLTSVSGVLNVPLKLGKLLNNESFIFKANINKTTETQIKGTLDNVTKTVSFIGDFKNGEYVRAINTASSVVLVRLADATNIDTIVGENNYLKKASQAQEDAGVIDTVATTPLVNKVTFGKRVNGSTESVPYLATALINGLYPKEHFQIVANIGANPIKNKGTFGAFNIAKAGGVNIPVSGDATTAVTVASNQDKNIIVLVTMANAMDNTNYVVKTFAESTGTIQTDNDGNGKVFKTISTTQFQFSMRSSGNGTEAIKIHFEVEQL